MKNILKIELNKALKNKWFYISVVIACSVTMISAIEFITMYLKSISEIALLEDVNSLQFGVFQSNSPFSRSIAVEPFTIGATIFYYIFPLLISIPYCWSYAYERKIGYEKNMIIRTGKFNYYIAKYIAIFLSGGLTILIALVFNFVILSLFIPLSTPNSYDMLTTAIYNRVLFSEIFYTVPFLYMFLNFGLNFIFAGLICCLAYSFSFFVKNRLLATVLPFMFTLVFSYLHKYIFTLLPTLKHYFDPMIFLRGAHSETSLIIIAIEILVLFFMTFGIVIIRGRKNEIY